MVLKIVHAVGDVIVGDMVGQQMNIVDEVVSLVRIFETSVSEDLEVLDRGVSGAQQRLGREDPVDVLLGHEGQQQVEALGRAVVAAGGDQIGGPGQRRSGGLDVYLQEADDFLHHRVHFHLQALHPESAAELAVQREPVAAGHVPQERLGEVLVEGRVATVDLQKAAQEDLLHALEQRELVAAGFELVVLLAGLGVHQPEERREVLEVLHGPAGLLRA